MSNKLDDKTTRDVLETDEKISKNGLRPEYNTSWAVVIGINEYQHLNKLEYAVADAKGIAELLKKAFGFPPDQVLLRCDGEANRDAIREIFSDILPKNTTSDDRVVIFFAGHGMKRKLHSGNSRGYLAPVDAEPDKWHTFVEIKELTDTGQLSAAKHVFYILDACYSGLATARGDEQPTRFQRDMLTHKARQALTAGLDDQVVDDAGPGNHSIFTYHLLEGLKGAADINKDGVITGTELMAYVKDQVGTDTESQQTPDYGLLLGHESGGDFVFVLPAVTQPVLDLSPWVTIHDAHSLGSSVATAVVTAMETYLAKRGLRVRLAADELHKRAKQHDGLADNGPGTYIEVATFVAEFFGVNPKGDSSTPDATYHGRFYPVASLNEIPEHLAVGRPILASFQINDSWFSAKNGVVCTPVEHNKTIGGIVITIVKYDPNEGVIVFANNWGEQWGDRGFGSMSIEVARTYLHSHQMWAVEVK